MLLAYAAGLSVSAALSCDILLLGPICPAHPSCSVFISDRLVNNVYVLTGLGHRLICLQDKCILDMPADVGKLI